MYKIIFMGTSDFAVPALTALNKSIYEVVLVVTQPDRPKGRGRRIIPTPVKTAAVNMGYDIIQPEKINTDDRFKVFLPFFRKTISYKVENRYSSILDMKKDFRTYIEEFYNV